MLEEHRLEYRTQWYVIYSIVTKIECSAKLLRCCLKIERRKRTQGIKASVLSDKEWINLLERENRELRRANEILRLALTYFTKAELDCMQK